MFSILNSLKKKYIPKSLLTRFMMIIILPTLVAQLFAVYLFYQRHWYNVSEHSSNLLSREIASLIKTKDYSSTPHKQQTYLSLKYTYILDAASPTTKRQQPMELRIFHKTLDKHIPQKHVVFLDKQDKINLYVKLGDNLLHILVPYKSLLNPTTYIFVLWILFLTILLLSISLIFSKNQIKSIIELTNAAERYGRGETLDEYKPSGAKEIRLAGLAFLKMKDRIKRQTAKRTQMLAMISHDLKTPLTRMKLQVALMDESEEKEELEYDIVSMQHMIASYLDFARGEGGEEFKEIDLNNWITEYIKNKWGQKNISVNSRTSPIPILIKPHSFERAISNLLTNALKYSTKIKISVYSLDDYAIITIEDNGKGIKEAERKLVFKPFYRADKSRSLDSHSSVGLGLAITKEIISGHYGNIILEDSKELKGLLVRIQIPIKTQIK